MKRILLTIILLAAVVIGASAQRYGSSKKKHNTNTISIGVGCGPRCDYIKITEFSSEFVDNEPLVKGHFATSVFVGWDFLDGRLGIRPQMSLLKRGASEVFWKGMFDPFGYEVEASYLDVRMPIVFNIKSRYGRSRVVPYVYAAPIWGMVYDGYIMIDDYTFSDIIDDVKVPVSDANIAKHYLGVGAGAGIKFQLNIGRTDFFFGLESMYDYGITDTYSKTEKDGKSSDMGYLVDYTHYKLKGKRKLSGLEFMAYFGMPFNNFSFHRREKPQTTRSVRNL